MFSNNRIVCQWAGLRIEQEMSGFAGRLAGSAIVDEFR